MYGQPQSRNFARGGKKNCKLVVKNTGEPSIMILEFMRNNLENIKRGGFFISITKVDEESLDKAMVRRLHSKGIYRFPALVMEGNRPMIGVNKIKDFVIKEVEKGVRMLSAQGPMNSMHPNPHLSDFYNQEMSHQALQREKDEMKGGVQSIGEGVGEDLNRRVSEMMRKKKISNESPEFDMGGRQGNSRESFEEEEDNIAPQYPQRGQRKEVSPDMFADDMAEAKFMEQAGQMYDY